MPLPTSYHIIDLDITIVKSSHHNEILISNLIFSYERFVSKSCPDKARHTGGISLFF